MCGICGIISKEGGTINKENLLAMARALAHRGPDGEGLYINRNAGLGHRRLSVIDLSDEARQPMPNEDSTIWIVFNGMIYNYRELRKELISRGHRFKSLSDTEVIVHLYEEAGVDCVKPLRGMFAFAIWDSVKNELLLARDRVGQKPLVYSESNEFVFFASEPKAIFAAGGLSKEIDLTGMHHFFSYMNVPWPYTMYKNVRQLPPASILKFNLNNKSSKIIKYWKPDLNNKLNINISEAENRVRSILEESVRLRLISDVPIGALLSGGVDSSSVVALMSRLSNRPVETFSVGFQASGRKDPEFDFSKIVSSAFGSRHHQVSIDQSIINILPQVLWFYDEPYANPVAMPHFELCRIMKKDVSVVLSGDGADEIFAGYPGYRRWHAVSLLNKFFPFLSALNQQDIPELIGALLSVPEKKRSARKRQFSKKVFYNLYTAQAQNEIKEIDTGKILEKFFLENNPGNILDSILFMDLLLYNAHGVSLFSDVSGMSWGLEIRTPFLDHKLIEFVFSLPSSMKIKGFLRTKYVLRRAMRDILPRAILSRRKLGYGEGIPFKEWFRNEWRDKIKQFIFDGGLKKSGFFRMDYVNALLSAHIKRKADNFDILWRLVCFSAWYDNVLKKQN